MATLDDKKRTRGRKLGRPPGSTADVRRQRILDVAEELFTESGGPPAMDAVAAAAGVTRTAIYHYFPTKQDLVRAVLMRGMDWNWWAGPIEQGRSLPTFSARLQSILRECIMRSRGETSGDFYWALVAASRADGEIRRAVRAYGDEMRKSVNGLIEDSISDGLLPKDTDSQALTKAVLGLVWCFAAGMRNTTSDRVREEIDSAAILATGDASAFLCPPDGRPPNRRGPRRANGTPETSSPRANPARTSKDGSAKRPSKSVR